MPAHTLYIFIYICFKLEHQEKSLSYGLVRKNRPKSAGITLNRNDREGTRTFGYSLHKRKRVLYGLLGV